MTERFRVLVVDDDAAVAGLHSRVVAGHPRFELAGVARCGRDAIAAARRLKPDLMLLDVYLPDVTGVEVLRRLRAQGGEDVDVIAITAAREVETVRAAMAGGVLHYLIKPFSLTELAVRLDRYVALRGEVAAAERGALDQAAVDSLLAGGGTRRPADAIGATPKGIAARTLAQVRSALGELGGDVSADEVGRHVGLSRVVARRYLEYLSQVGEVSGVPRYGTPGRPETRYRRAE